MKAIVTGGCGFIGSHLVDHLLKNGFTTIVIDNFSTGRPENLAHQKDNKLLQIIQDDIGDESFDLNPYFNDADYVFHFAALADIVPSVKKPHAYFKSNVQGTFRVLEAAKTSSKLKKFIYPASSTCYGIPKAYPTSETEKIDPQYPYALTKNMGEELALHWAQLYKLPALSLRFFNVYGPRSRTSGTYGAVFGVFLAQKLANEPYTVVGDGEQTRDFTYVEDIVSAVWTAAESTATGEIFNVGSGNTYSINYLVQLLGGPKIHIPKRPGEPDCTFADISKIEKIMQWKPKVSFEEGVQKMLNSISYWKDAPVWNPEKIASETQEWFKLLS